MSVYYKIIGHLEDQEQEVGTYIFNDEQPISYLKKMFRNNLLLKSERNTWELYPETSYRFYF